MDGRPGSEGGGSCAAECATCVELCNLLNERSRSVARACRGALVAVRAFFWRGGSVRHARGQRTAPRHALVRVPASNTHIRNVRNIVLARPWVFVHLPQSYIVHVEADVHISNESIHVQHAPPAPLAAAPHAERVRAVLLSVYPGLASMRTPSAGAKRPFASSFLSTCRCTLGSSRCLLVESNKPP